MILTSEAQAQKKHSLYDDAAGGAVTQTLRSA